MFCSNCGNQIDDHAAQCPFCGTATEETPAQNADTLPNWENDAAYTPAPVPDPAPKKKKTALYVTIGAVAAVLIAGVVLLLTVGKGLFLRTFGSPEDYYHYVEEKNIRSASKQVADWMSTERIGNVREKGSMTLTLSDSAKTLIKQSGTDLSWLDSAKVDFDANWKNSNIDGTVSLSLNDEDDLYALDFAMDAAENGMYIRIPEISDTFIDMSDKLEEVFYDVSLAETLEIFEKLPDSELTAELLEKYMLLAVNDLNSVEKSTETLTAGDVSERCTALTVTISEKDVQNIVRDICKAAKEDDDLKQYIKDLEDVTGEELYDEFKEALKEGIDQADEIEFDGKIVMTVYVSGDGDIRGRTFEVRSDSNKIMLTFAFPEKKDKIGLEISYKNNNTKAVISGEGTKKSGIFNATLTLAVDGAKYGTLDIRDYDLKAAEKGELVGGFTLKLSQKVYEEAYLDSTTSALLSTLSLSVDFNNTKDKVDTTVAVQVGGEDFASLAYKLDVSDAKSPMKVSDTMELDDWLEKVERDGSLYTFGLKLTRRLPAELVDLLDLSDISNFGY